MKILLLVLLACSTLLWAPESDPQLLVEAVTSDLSNNRPSVSPVPEPWPTPPLVATRPKGSTPGSTPSARTSAPAYRTFDGIRYHVVGHLWIDPEGKVWKPITCTTTAYTWVDGIGDPWVPAPGVTAKGKDARVTRGVATNWRLLPPGTRLRIPGYGDTVVDDRCGAAYTAWKKEREVVVDLRIPNRGPKGNWRSNDHIVDVALNHGRQEDRVVLKRVR